MEISDIFAEDIKKYPLLSFEETMALARRVRLHHDQEARDKLVRHNLRLVLYCAHRYRWPNMELMDAVGAGVEGLMRAAELFDDRRQLHFSTYAVWWIRQAIRREAARFARIVHVPERTVDEHQHLRRIQGLFFNVKGRKPTFEEVRYIVGERLGILRRMRDEEKGLYTDHLYARVDEEIQPRGQNEEEPRFLHDVISGGIFSSPELVCLAREKVTNFYRFATQALFVGREVVPDLDKRFWFLLMRYGLHDGTFSINTLQTIACAVSPPVTRECVRQGILRSWSLLERRFRLEPEKRRDKWMRTELEGFLTLREMFVADKSVVDAHDKFADAVKGWQGHFHTHQKKVTAKK